MPMAEVLSSRAHLAYSNLRILAEPDNMPTAEVLSFDQHTTPPVNLHTAEVLSSCFHYRPANLPHAEVLSS